jgi:hypothetical protein
MDFRLINSVEEEDECCVCVANAVKDLISVKMARVCLAPRFVPYYVKFYDPASTQQDAYLLNQLELTTEISQKVEYLIVKINPLIPTDTRGTHTSIGWESRNSLHGFHGCVVSNNE